MKRSTKGWHPADIKAGLTKRGYSYARLSLELGHQDRSTAHKVLRKPYPLVEKIIADILGVHPRMIWPDRYRKDGSPRGKGIRGQYNKSPQMGNGKERGAA